MLGILADLETSHLVKFFRVHLFFDVLCGATPSSASLSSFTLIGSANQLADNGSEQDKSQRTFHLKER